MTGFYITCSSTFTQHIYIYYAVKENIYKQAFLDNPLLVDAEHFYILYKNANVHGPSAVQGHIGTFCMSFKMRFSTPSTEIHFCIHMIRK